MVEPLLNKKNQDHTERINFTLEGEPALWLTKMKERGFFNSNPEALRLAIIILRNHFANLGINLDK